MADSEAAQAQLVRTRDEQRNQFLRDIKLSIRYQQGVPSLLLAAPSAINLLGNLRFFAYKEEAMRIRLTLRSDPPPLLQHRTLPAAIEQICIQTRNAFAIARKNMFAIEKYGQHMFGGGGQMQEILDILSDHEYARKALKPAMEDLHENMGNCVDKASEIDTQFQILNDLAKELHLVLTDETTTTKELEVGAKREQSSAERRKLLDEARQKQLQEQVEKAEKQSDLYTKQFLKTAKNNEWKMLGLKAAGDFEGAIFGIVNQATNVPRLAAQAVEAVSRIRNPAGEVLTADPQLKQESTNKTAGYNDTNHFDPALANAEELYNQIAAFQGLVSGDLQHMLREKGEEEGLKNCLDLLRGLKETLTGSRSEHVTDANETLRIALQTGEAILNSQGFAMQIGKPSEDWTRNVQKWRNDAATCMQKAVKLQAFASSQPGQAFGNSSSSGLDTHKGSEFLLSRRLVRLQTMQSAMEKAKDDLQRTIHRCQQNSINVLKLADDIDKFQQDKESFAKMLKILTGAITVISNFQEEIQRLMGYFNDMSSCLEIVGQGQVKIFLRTVDSGIRGEGADLQLAYQEAQVKTIRNTLLQLRGNFGQIVDEARLYRQISTAQIEPCFEMVSELPMSRISAEEEREKKQELAKYTTSAANEIKTIAEQEGRKMAEQFDARIIELGEEVQQLQLPGLPVSTTRAIQEGVEEASYETLERQERRMPPETLEDL